MTLRYIKGTTTARYGVPLNPATPVENNSKYTPPKAPNWDYAACRTTGWTDDFFPTKGESSPDQPYMYREAAKLCAVCPLMDECLTYGMMEPYGMWGGTTPDQRKILRTLPVEDALETAEKMLADTLTDSEERRSKGRPFKGDTHRDEIRRKHQKGVPMTVLSREYGLHKSTISRLIHG
jgi:WhiB family redox-sensing transcriptional regulator